MTLKPKKILTDRIKMVNKMKINISDYSKGEIIKIIREWTELTQKDFAKKIGKSKRTIEEYESNRVSYSIDTLKKIGETFTLDITIEKKK